MLDGSLGRVFQLDLTPHVGVHRHDMATACRSNRCELIGRGERVFDSRYFGADIDGNNGPTVGDQVCDGGRADPTSGSGNEGDRSVHGNLSSLSDHNFQKVLYQLLVNGW